MISDYRCFFCFSRAFERLLEKEKLTREQKNAFTARMAELYYRMNGNFIAPLLSREMHVELNQTSDRRDFYAKIKKESNDHILRLYPVIKKKVEESDNPFETALLLSVAGNVMDYAISSDFNIEATIERVLKTGLSIDHSASLRKAISEADTVLYIGDNAGEIVFDKLLIETIKHPDLWFAVRGAPVSNDATFEDVEYIGMDHVANIISNGYDAPSTILKKCSGSFQEIFKRADLIISKGQGNLEGLLPLNDSRIYYLTMAKCDVVADYLQVPRDSFVVFNNSYTGK